MASCGERRCRVHDGRERCCLIIDHTGPHMGRWHTMRQEEIDAFSESFSSEEERRKVLGYSLEV